MKSGQKLALGAIIICAVIFAAGVVTYLFADIYKLLKAADPYERYGVEVPEDFESVFYYKSEPGFTGDHCTVEKYKTVGEDFFDGFLDGPSAAAEDLMDFTIGSAGVPEDHRPDYSEGYKYRIYEYEDDRLVIIFFPEEKAAYFGDAII